MAALAYTLPEHGGSLKQSYSDVAVAVQAPTWMGSAMLVGDAQARSTDVQLEAISLQVQLTSSR